MRCEGWRRKGGALSFGPPQWKQCEEESIVMLRFTQGDESEKTLPACNKCWHECIGHKDITVLEVKPVISESPKGGS